MVFIVPPLFCAYCVCLSLLHVALLLTMNGMHMACTVYRPSIRFYAVIHCQDAPGSKEVRAYVHARLTISYARCGQPWVRDTLCLRSSQFAMKTAPSSPAPVLPAANKTRAAGLVLFSARPEAK